MRSRTQRLISRGWRMDVKEESWHYEKRRLTFQMQMWLLLLRSSEVKASCILLLIENNEVQNQSDQNERCYCPLLGEQVWHEPQKFGPEIVQELPLVLHKDSAEDAAIALDLLGPKRKNEQKKENEK